MTTEQNEPRLLELCRRVVTLADGGELFIDDSAVRAILDDPAAAVMPITPEDEPGIASSDWTAPAGGWPKREWLIEGWLPLGRLGMISGRGGRGKSRLVLQLAARMASETPKDGHVLLDGAYVEGLKETESRQGNRHPFTLDRAHCGPVVFASWEDERDEVGRRLAAMAEDKLVDVAGLKDRFLYLDLRGKGPLWSPAEDRHVQTLARLTMAGHRVRKTAEDLGARLLVLDSLAAAYASDENARPLVRAFCSSWDAWATENRCAVLLVAHPPKRPARSSGSTIDEDTDDDFAGSTDWHNAVRFRWSLGNADTGRRRVQKGGKKDTKGTPVTALALACKKSSYGERPPQSLFLAPADKGAVGWKAVFAFDAARRDVRDRFGWELRDTNQEATNGEKRWDTA